MSDAPAGWHPDPRGRHEHRYWDGNQWTDHVADAGVMANDPVAEVTPVAAPSGPSLVNLPAITPTEPGIPSESAVSGTGPLWAGETAASEPEPSPEPVREPDPEREPMRDPEPVAGVAGGPPPTAVHDHDHDEHGHDHAHAEHGHEHAADEGHGIASPLSGERSPDLGALLSVVVPGSGHLYLGRASAVAYGLLGATLVAVILAYFSFLLFVVGLVIWAGAAVYGLMDLRGGLSGLRETRLSAHLVGWILVAAGVALIVSLVLPWYHVKVDISVTGLGGISGNQSRNFSGFGSFDVIDIILLVVGVAAVLAGLAALGKGPISADELPSFMPIIVAVGGAGALVLTYYRLFVDPVPGFGSALGGAGTVDISVGRGPGGLLAAGAAIAILVASASVLTAPRTHTYSTA